MSYQYDLMGVIICWALTSFVVLLILVLCIGLLYYIFSNEAKIESKKGVKEIVKIVKETAKEITQ